MSTEPPAKRDSVATKLIAFRRDRDVKVRPRHQVRWTDPAGDHVLTLGDRMLAGSSASAKIVVADPTVSRVHAEIETRDADVWVHDLGSRNGTYVEDIQVSSARVPDGGRVRLGETTLVLERESEPGIVQLWHEDRFGPLVGASMAMRALFTELANIADSDGSVLIQGETGTGKELVARAIHDASSRRAQPFVIIDCAALPEHLIESELFGHAKGAFTGAANARAGAIEAAHTGTVFLDEIGELPLAMQPKLLRAVESRAVRRVGETEYRQVDVRFVCATHRDLPSRINAGAFREDLYFRLAVLPITMPPLRVRPDDIPALVRSFVPGASFSPELMKALAARPWFGNVRELRNFIERTMVFGEGRALASLEPSRAPNASGQYGAVIPAAPGDGDAAPRVLGMPEMSIDVPFKEAREKWLDQFEREYLLALLARHDRNVAAAASAAGLDRTYVYRLIRKHGV